MSANNLNTKHNCVNCFKSLGVETRFTIYKTLEEKGKLNVSDLVDTVSLTQPTVSYHLHEMEKTGLLISEKKGKNVFYSINKACPHDGHACVLQGVKVK